MNCQARVLDVVHTIPNTKLVYHTTTECGEEISKKLSVDSGEAYMGICGRCFRRYTAKDTWYGWFDGSYPPQAKVRGSKWYYEQLSVKTENALIEPEDIIQGMAEMSLEEAEVEEEEAEEAEVEEVEEKAEVEEVEEAEEEKAEAEAEVEEKAEAEVEEKAEEKVKKEDKKLALRARIKEIQANAKPGKMSLKDIQAAFKEITDLKTQIHML
jgi:hypothetical protein